MGIRGGTLPGTQRRPITSYIADYVSAAAIGADYQELAPVQAEVIAPVRTLAEKLALLHHAGEQAAHGNPAALQQSGRHFYDIYQLAGAAEVVCALSAPGQDMEVLAADVDGANDRHLERSSRVSPGRPTCSDRRRQLWPQRSRSPIRSRGQRPSRRTPAP
jgi:hypothetical protein